MSEENGTELQSQAYSEVEEDEEDPDTNIVALSKASFEFDRQPR